jgi:spore coat protein A
MNRRKFLKTSAMAGAGALLLRGRSWAFNTSPPNITKFQVTLPGLTSAGANNMGNYIPALAPTTINGTDNYHIVAKQFTQQLHPNIPATTFWGYADATTPDSKYLGGVIVAKRGRPVKLKVTNQLPANHILPVDTSLVDPTMLAETGGRTDRLAIHLHGGLIRWDMDGGPFHWFSNPANPGGFVHGSSFANGAEAGSAVYDYPNNQSARLIWYHDHAYSLTRINAYAGMATAYVITDDAETLLVKSGVLPNFPGYPVGIPLVVQDKSFWYSASDADYPSKIINPTSPVDGGSLWYPWDYDGNIWELKPDQQPILGPSTVPEFFSDIMLVNGAPYPTFGPLPAQRFRFRFLNGSQARFYNLQLYVADPNTPDGINYDSNGVPTNQPGPAFIQIGTECGFLPAPAVFTADGTNKNSNRVMAYKVAADPADPTNGNPISYNLVMAPAERPDVIIDFRGFAGTAVNPTKLILYNDAPAPFPGGDPNFDKSTPGEGPDTRILMRFEIGPASGLKELSFKDTVNALKLALPVTFLVTQPSIFIKPDSLAKVKTLNEDFDQYGRLRQVLGAPGVTDYLSTPTDSAAKGEVQQWKIYNLTGDTHPMHFHLVNVVIRKREQWKYTTDSSGVTVPVLPLQPIPGTARLPDVNEMGWKETVRMNPGEVITVDMKFDMPSGAKHSPRLKASYGIKGAEYVWHCHILEHEEHDMMHALVVTGGTHD